MELDTSPKHLMILGSRGIPACHGGFETFAEHLALYLVGRGWRVSVYCQDQGDVDLHETQWEGIRLVHIPAGDNSPLATIWFDLRSTLHAADSPGLILTLGYNTAIFLAWYRLRNRCNIINMDGIEWRRSKWSFPARVWLYCNEYLATWFANYLIADNPGIKEHFVKRVRKEDISMIPYGAPAINSADPSLLQSFDLKAGQYVLIVARGEPENSILEIIKAFTRQRRGIKLVIVGKYHPELIAYHRQVLEAANDEVTLTGAIYDSQLLSALRFHARLYVHGHQVGGTNPSLVEALGAGNPVLAHDNKFNRWVADNAGRYFTNEDSCAHHFDNLLDDDIQLAALRSKAIERHREVFQWPTVFQQYEDLLNRWHK
jgi:glycosyltransferase involved in cell wall biosynthesis